MQMKNLQRIRKEKGISQSELSKISDVNVRMIQKYEIGEKDINKASALTVYKLSLALEVNVSDLLEL